jgi:hypothetical protein
MESMRIEWEIITGSRDIQFVAINAWHAEEDQDKLIEHCAFPLFQELEDEGLWTLHGGKKDDFFIYDRQGNLAAYLPSGGELSTSLATAEGQANLKSAIMAVYSQEVGPTAPDDSAP